MCKIIVNKINRFVKQVEKENSLIQHYCGNNNNNNNHSVSWKGIEEEIHAGAIFISNLLLYRPSAREDKSKRVIPSYRPYS